MASTQEQELAGILLELGYVHQEQINEALELQKIRPKRLDALLSDLGYVQEDHLLEALGRQYGMPFEPNIQKQVDTSLTTKVPINFIREYQMVPYQRNGAGYYVALHDPANLLPLDDLRLLLNGPVQPVLCRKADIQAIIDNYFEQQGESAADMIGTIAMSEEEGETAYQTLDALESERDLLDLANEAPIIRLINLLISGAVRERASDIHVEPFERDVRVRYRIDGVLYEKFVVPKSQQAAVTSRIKIMASLNIAEHRLPQDGRIKTRVKGRELDLRVSTVPTVWGESVVMRVLDRASVRFGLDDMGFEPDTLARFKQLIHRPHGILLVTGPTGSGKTTTLYAALATLDAATQKIITVEDPVEYQLEGINQIQVHPQINLSFANALRSILRQDPDIIMIGEMRDGETAQIAVQSSLTGHLVLSTLHTNTAASAVIRMQDMGVERYLITSTVNGVLAQRLVRRLCPHCKTPVQPTPALLQSSGLGRFLPAGQPMYQATGCEHCRGTGYQGRGAIHELLVVDETLRSAILQGHDAGALQALAVQGGMLTLYDDGLRKVAAGVTSLDELLRVTQDQSEA